MAGKVSTAVAPKEEAGKIQLPDGLDLAQLQADAAHNEVMTPSDIALPYLYALQTNSPQVNPGLPAFVEGAQASMFFNNVSGEIFEGRVDGLLVVPCAYERKLVEWTPRETGGGWIADYEVENPVMRTTKLNERKKPILPNGNLLVETAYQYMLWMHPETGNWSQGVISLSSTGLKTNRKWNNEITTSMIPGTEHQAPRFLFPYQVTTYLETRNGNSWWALNVKKQEKPVMASLYQEAKKFAELVRAGAIKRQAEQQDVGEGDRDIPF